MRQLHLQPRIKSSASQTEERLCMVPPGRQTQVAPPPAGSAPQQQTSPISHSQQRVLKRTQQSPEARGFCGWTAVRRGSKNKNTSPGYKLVPTPYLSICILPGPNYPVPKMSMRPALPRTRESQPQPTSSNGAPLAPLFSKRRSSGRDRARAENFSASTEQTTQMAKGAGVQQMQRSSPVSAVRKAKNHLKRRAKLRKLAASRRVLVSMWVGYFYDRQRKPGPP